MVAQAFQEIPKSHCIAVAFGLLPMLASWGLQLVDLALRKGGSSLLQAAPKFGEELAIYGLIALSQGALLVSMVRRSGICLQLCRRCPVPGGVPLLQSAFPVGCTKLGIRVIQTWRNSSSSSDLAEKKSQQAKRRGHIADAEQVAEKSKSVLIRGPLPAGESLFSWLLRTQRSLASFGMTIQGIFPQSVKPRATNRFVFPHQRSWQAAEKVVRVVGRDFRHDKTLCPLQGF